jgi:hypothetical protein
LPKGLKIVNNCLELFFVLIHPTFSGLLLLATCAGDRSLLEECLALAQAGGKQNIVTTAALLLGDGPAVTRSLVGSGRFSEACFFSRTYCPSQLEHSMNAWQEDLSRVNPKLANSLARAEVLENFEKSLQTEKLVRAASVKIRPAKQYTEVKNLLDVDVSSVPDLRGVLNTFSRDNSPRGVPVMTPTKVTYSRISVL